MSIENHPNFHAVKFVTDVTVAFFESLRGSATPSTVDAEKFRELTIEFTSACESLADNNSDAEAYNPNLDKD